MADNSNAAILPEAVGRLFLLLGDKQNQSKMSLPALPKARVPGATGFDINWEKLTKAILANSQSQ